MAKNSVPKNKHDEIEDSELEEEMVSMLEDEYGKDTEVLQLIKELEKNPGGDDKSEDEEDDSEKDDLRRCRECGLETVVISGQCSECGAKCDFRKSSGYNSDEDEEF